VKQTTIDRDERVYEAAVAAIREYAEDIEREGYGSMHPDGASTAAWKLAVRDPDMTEGQVKASLKRLAAAGRLVEGKGRGNMLEYTTPEFQRSRLVRRAEEEAARDAVRARWDAVYDAAEAMGLEVEVSRNAWTRESRRSGLSLESMERLVAWAAAGREAEAASGRDAR
jgi:hypothetical protein